MQRIDMYIISKLVNSKIMTSLTFRKIWNFVWTLVFNILFVSAFGYTLYETWTKCRPKMALWQTAGCTFGMLIACGLFWFLVLGACELGKAQGKFFIKNGR